MSSTRQLITTLRGLQNRVKAITFSPDDKRIFSASDDGEIRIWETEFASARQMWEAAAEREK